MDKLSRHTLAYQVKTGKLTKVCHNVVVKSPPSGASVLKAVLGSHPKAAATGQTAAEIYQGLPISLPVKVKIPQVRQSTDLVTFIRSSNGPFHNVNGYRVQTPLLAATHMEDAAAVELLEAVYSKSEGRARLERHLSYIKKLPSKSQKLLEKAVLFTDSGAEIKVVKALRTVIDYPILCNYTIGTYLWDIVIPRLNLAIEINGYEFHSKQPEFIRDHWKNNDAVARGWRTLRYTGHCVAHHLEDIVEQIRTIDEPDFKLRAHVLVHRWHQYFHLKGEWFGPVELIF